MEICFTCGKECLTLCTPMRCFECVKNKIPVQTSPVRNSYFVLTSEPNMECGCYIEPRNDGTAVIFRCPTCESKPWHETEAGKKALLDIINETYWFQPDGTAKRKDEFCNTCKNELVACVCM